MIHRVSVSQNEENEWWLSFYADDVRYGVSLNDVLLLQATAQSGRHPTLSSAFLNGVIVGLILAFIVAVLAISGG